MNSHNLPLSHFHLSKLHTSETSQFRFSDLFSSLSLLRLQQTSFGPMLLNTITILLTHKFISSTILHLAFQTYIEMSPQYLYLYFIVVAQSPTCVQFFQTPWTAARQACLSLTISWSLPKFMSIESVMPSNHLILYHPVLLLPSIFPSIRVFFPVSWLFTSGGQKIGALASASILQMIIQGCYVCISNDYFKWKRLHST